MAIDLEQLPYPRHVHKTGEPSRVVSTVGACVEALADGYALLPEGAEYSVPGAVEIRDADPDAVDEPARSTKKAKK